MHELLRPVRGATAEGILIPQGGHRRLPALWPGPGADLTGNDNGAHSEHIQCDQRHRRGTLDVGSFRGPQSLLQAQAWPGRGAVHGGHGDGDADNAATGAHPARELWLSRGGAAAGGRGTQCDCWFGAAAARQVAHEGGVR